MWDERDSRSGYEVWLLRFAYLLWALAGILLPLRTAFFSSDPHRGVFDIYYEAALCFRAGQEVFAANPGFLYPPFALVLLTPFSFAGEQIGGVFWRVFTFSAYFGSILWALHAWFPTQLGRRARAGFLVLLVVPSLGAINNGQVNPVLFGLVLSSAVAASQGRYRLAAFLAAPGVGLKLYPIAFALLLGALEPRRVLPWLVFGLFVVFALPYAFQESSYVTQLHHDMIDRLRGDSRIDKPNFRDVRRVLKLFGISVGATAYLVVEAVAALGMLALTLRTRSIGYAVAFACCWMTIFGPATEKASYILVSPVLCWCIAAARSRIELSILLAAFVVFMYPLVPIGSLLRSPSAMLAMPLAVTVLFGVLVVRALQEPRAVAMVRTTAKQQD